MITNKENWILLAMIKMDDKLVEEHMKEYDLSEKDARKDLAETYYYNQFER